MKKYLFSVICVILFLLSSCQSTPSNLSVLHKSGENLIRIIKESNDKKIDNSAVLQLRGKHITDSYMREKLTCNIDSTIEIPVSNLYPVIRVEPYRFSAADVENTIRAVIPNAKLNVIGDGSVQLQLSKKEIESFIIYLKSQISNPTSSLNQQKTINPVNYGEMLKGIEESIEELEEMYSDAPDSVPTVDLVITNSLLENGFFATSQDHLVYSLEDELPTAIDNLYVSNTVINDGRANQITITHQNVVQQSSDFDNSSNLSHESLINIAENLVQKTLGYKYMEQVYFEDNLDSTFTIVFMRNFSGVSSNYASQDISMDAEDQQMVVFSAGWPYEKITVIENTLGDIELYKYTAPLVETTVLTENAPLLQLDDILDIFKQQISNQEYWISDDNVIAKTININAIKLGMMRINLTSETDGYIVVPVWDFYGSSRTQYNSQDNSEYVLSDNNDYVSDQYPYSLCTINAIDGTIINRDMGY